MGRKAIECVNCGSNTGLDIDSLVDCIIVKGKVAHLPGLEVIMAEIAKMRLDSRSQLASELVRRVEERFIIPEGEEDDYRIALLDDYDRRIMEFI